MRKSVLALVLVAASAIALPAFAADAPAVVRKVLQQNDIAGGQTLSVVEVTIPVGGREGRHTHPGPLALYVISGAISLDHEGKANITYKPGQTFFVESGKVHEGINRGAVPFVGIATFITPKGQSLTTQVK